MPDTLSKKIAFNGKVILFFFIFTTFSGALRKWVVASESVNSLILLIQLGAPIVVFSLLRGIQNKFAQSFITVIYAFMLLTMALNPMNQTIMHGFLGFILHFGFWLLMFLYLDNREAFPVENLTKALFIICSIELILAIVQFSLPPTHFINRYSNSSDPADIAQIGDFVRVTGSFSYISGFGCFLFFAGSFIWGAFVGNSLSNLARYIFVLFFLTTSLMSGSRSVMAMSVLFIIFALTEMRFKQKMTVLFITALTVTLISIYSLEEKIPFVKDAFNAFYDRTTELNAQGEDRMRIYGPFTEVIEFRGKYPLFGVGLGATYQGAISKWGRSQYVQEYGYFEEEPERIVIEGGFLLFIMRFVLFGVILFKTHIPRLYLLPVFALLLFYMPMVFNVYLSAYSFLGLMYLDKIYFLKKSIQ